MILGSDWLNFIQPNVISSPSVVIAAEWNTPALISTNVSFAANDGDMIIGVASPTGVVDVVVIPVTCPRLSSPKQNSFPVDCSMTSVWLCPNAAVETLILARGSMTGAVFGFIILLTSWFSQGDLFDVIFVQKLSRKKI